MEKPLLLHEFIFEITKMLTRRHLRIKVMQAVYAHQSIGDEPLDSGERKMLRSFEQLYDLYICQLAFLVEIFDYAGQKAEEGKRKQLPSKEDLQADTRFTENKLIRYIRTNKAYLTHYNRLHINWREHYDLVRKAYQCFRNSSFYQDYIQKSQSTFYDERRLLVALIKECISDFDLLKYHYEEKNIFWDEDYYAATMMLLETIDNLSADEDESAPLPGVFKDENSAGNSEDREFAVELFRKTIRNFDDYKTKIAAKAKNWDFERIARVDMILLEMAMAELLNFPSIPVKVTMNEYIEISKYYSTPKSRVFINGVLDNIIAEYTKNNIIHKTGRGLKNN
ncbi:MAG: transcription antitermination factor NusB [Bacteroidales bacterium]